MCGIAGIVSTSAPIEEATLLAMGDAIAHRGPDSAGIWRDTSDRVGFSHRRLSILDISELGAQPMASRSGRFVICYNGEIYNFHTLRERLGDHQQSLKSSSDTEVLVEHIEAFGLAETLNHVAGMFAFAVYDQKTQTLSLARDHLGKKPLYYGWSGDRFIFASELKAFHALPGFRAEIDRSVLALYLKYACVPQPHCLLKGLRQLPAGSCMEFAVGKLEANVFPDARPFWSAQSVVEARDEDRATYQHDDATTLAEFSDILLTCVRERMISDVPLGAFLSGGIDSSTVVALMQSISTDKVKTFSIGFDEAAYNEAAFSKDVAGALGTDHHEFYVTPKDALDVVPSLPDIYDEPFADISQIPTFIVAKMSRQHVSVALTGDGGDEMLGGYRRHNYVPRTHRSMGGLPAFLGRPAGSTARALGRLNRSSERRKKVGSLADILSGADRPEIYDGLVQYLDPADILTDDLDETPRWDQNVPPLSEGLSLAEDLMLRDSLLYLPNDILTKVDRATMAVSLEARAPLLDRRLFEYVWTLPDHFKIRAGTGKWLLRQVLGQHIPLELFDRPKTGFAAPVSSWLREDLRPWAEAFLSAERLEDSGFRVDAVQQLWRQHLSGRFDHGKQLWIILQFQAWWEHYRRAS